MKSPFVTYFAAKPLLGLLAGVHARVSLQPAQLYERLVAALARVALRLHVPLYVPAEPVALCNIIVSLDYEVPLTV